MSRAGAQISKREELFTLETKAKGKFLAQKQKRTEEKITFHYEVAFLLCLW